MRAVCIMLLLFLLTGGGSAWGQMMLLEEEASKDHSGAGVTFLLLSVVTLAYGLKSFNDSQDDLDRADASFAQYQAAPTTALQVATSDALNDARVNEDRANAAVFLTILFGLTSYYSFYPEDLPDVSLAATPGGILYRYRF
ncbi:MAG: hypothetical protein O7A69_15940 [SAR324 cluster bacterium]|nr:hypothetical protein [SAR324 cluster bacterium]MCZ6728752.1 hypothetical protein [SAR324 cluster bacterium]MCZ6841256.1 hypothetical protein [SAR324 cluster bacterium]